MFRRNRPGARRYAQTLLTAMETNSTVAESYRMLRTNITMGYPEVQSILVTSAGRGEGKSITAANLAVVLAQSDRTVALVDADLRIPSTHSVFNLPPRRGRTIGAALVEPTDADTVLSCMYEVVPGLHVLTARDYAPEYPSEVLGSEKFSELIQTLVELFDYVIVDTAPVGLVTDAVVASQHVDGVLFVVDHSSVRRRFVERAMGELQKAGRNVIGTVLNRFPVKTSDQYVLGGEYYRHGSGDPDRLDHDRLDHDRLDHEPPADLPISAAQLHTHPFTD